MSRGDVNARRAAVFGLAVLLAGGAAAQGLRFSNHREISVPDYATFRIGPFYSTVALYLEAGWRYTESRGAGTDFLYERRRGRIQRDGHEYPMIAALIFRNYLILTPSADIDASVRVQYEHYPMGTQEDEFRVDLAEEGVFGNLSSEFALTPYIKGRIYDDAAYRTDYIDTRGLEDPYGGQRYEHFVNKLGIDMDWLMAADKNLGLSASRTDTIPFSEEFLDQERVTYAEALGYEQSVFSGFVLGAWARYTQEEYGATNRTYVTTENYYLTVSLDREAGIPLTRATTLELGIGYWQGRYYGQGFTNSATVSTIAGMAAIKTQMSQSLSHRLSYSRQLMTDFNFPLAVVDQYDYRIDWAGYWIKAGAFAGLRVLDPARDEWLGYRDWRAGADASVPITPYIILTGSTLYQERENEPVPDEPRIAGGSGDAAETGVVEQLLSPNENIDAEWASNYATWMSRVGLIFKLTEELSFEVYAQRIERLSEDERLAYERDIYAARFMYLHEF